MYVRSLRLVDFRSYEFAEATFCDGLTAVVGSNGQGKTNLIEAVSFVAGFGSLRAAVDAAMVRQGAPEAQLRCEVIDAGGRDVTINAHIRAGRPNRFLINSQRASRAELSETLTVTVFSPDDLALVKADPANRRRWLDTALVALRPANGVLRADVDKILRQRNALLRQAGGRASADVITTLDVWDAKLAAAGDELRRRRRQLLNSVRPFLRSCYDQVSCQESDHSAGVDAQYLSSWGEESLAEALAAARDDDLRRAQSTVGPHRDDMSLSIASLPARSHASQGEQRSLALALRLAVDRAVRDTRGVSPVLLLDDVFSELDGDRCEALVAALPAGQRIITTADGLPAGVTADQTIRVDNGTLQFE